MTTLLAIQARVVDTLERARQQGRVYDPDVALLAHLFTGSLRAAILYRLTEPDAMDPETTADQVVRYFLEGARIA